MHAHLGQMELPHNNFKLYALAQALFSKKNHHLLWYFASSNELSWEGTTANNSIRLVCTSLTGLSMPCGTWLFWWIFLYPSHLETAFLEASLANPLEAFKPGGTCFAPLKFAGIPDSLLLQPISMGINEGCNQQQHKWQMSTWTRG